VNRYLFVCVFLLPWAVAGQPRRVHPADRYEATSSQQSPQLLAITPEASYQEYQRKIADEPGPIRPCADDVGRPLRCKGEYVVPPLLPNTYGGDAWIPVDQFHDGPAQLAKWLTKATSGTLECFYGFCSFFSFGIVPSGWPADSLLLHCEVLKDNSIAAPPESCTAIAAIRIAGSYIATVTFRSPPKSLPMTDDEDFGFQLWFVGPSALNSIRTAVQHGFEAIKLETIARKAKVVGSAKYRPSPVIQGWRDYITVRALLEEGDQAGLFELGVATTIYVNRQNTDRPDDWHLPSVQQHAAYISAISRSLKRELQRICPTGAWRDAETFVCSR
jgi:hypothetical protein